LEKLKENIILKRKFIGERLNETKIHIL